MIGSEHALHFFGHLQPFFVFDVSDPFIYGDRIAGVIPVHQLLLHQREDVQVLLSGNMQPIKLRQKIYTLSDRKFSLTAVIGYRNYETLKADIIGRHYGERFQKRIAPV